MALTPKEMDSIAQAVIAMRKSGQLHRLLPKKPSPTNLPRNVVPIRRPASK